jgi:hypothetical protein
MNYVGQSGRTITTRHKEHIRYVKNNYPASTYAVHLLNNKHEYGTTENTLQRKQQNEPMGEYVYSNLPPIQ